MKASSCLGFRTLLAFFLCGALAACASSSGSGGPEDPTDVGSEDPLAGGEGDTLPPPPPPEPEPEPEPTGPGQLKIAITASGQEAMGKLRILTAAVDPQVVDEGPATKTYDLPAGEYDIEVTLETTLDRPERRLRDVPIKAGEVTEREVDFTIGQLTLRPVRGSRKVGSTIRWRYAGGGDWFEESSQAGEEVILSTGRYDAEVQVGRTKITIRDIQVYEGKRTITTEVQMR